MSITCRIFIANGVRLTPVPQARWTRLMEGEETVPYDANHEVRTLEVSVEVERRVIRRVGTCCQCGSLSTRTGRSASPVWSSARST
jgi:hypothetical protein